MEGCCASGLVVSNGRVDLDHYHPLQPLVTVERFQRFHEVLAQRLTSVRVVIEDLCDPHNVAAILRTAEALGMQDVHIVERAARLRPSRSTTAGADRWLSIERHDRLAACIGTLQARGFDVWGADVIPGACPVETIDVSRPVALVLGSERVGLSRVARRHVDGFCKIPLAGLTASLNVSVAAAIAMHTLASRRRTFLGQPGDLPVERQKELLDRWLRVSVRCSGPILKELEKRRSDP